MCFKKPSHPSQNFSNNVGTKIIVSIICVCIHTCAYIDIYTQMIANNFIFHCCLFCLDMVSLFILGYPETWSVDQAGLELRDLLPLPPKCWH